MKKKAIIFVAACLTKAELQAEFSGAEDHWGVAFLELCYKENIQVISLPCSETEYCGALRKKHGIDFYTRLDGYSDYCKNLAKKTVSEVNKKIQNGYSIIACLGVEHSPSCAVTYLYSHRGMLKQRGIFFEALFQELLKYNIEIELVGINRRYPRRSYKRLKEIISEWKLQ